MMTKLLYHRMREMVLTEEDLNTYGYPRPHSQPGRAVIHRAASHYNIMNNFNTRTCQRCKTSYSIDAAGNLISPEPCNYHWAKLSTGTVPTYYCCRGKVSSQPCCTAPRHVSDQIDPDNLIGFINTQQSHARKESIFAMDCEMVHTSVGMDVAAISMVDCNSKSVYETLILPDAPVIDYNTKHSGLTEKEFDGVTTRLRDVHNKLLSLVGSQTILIGHGLNNDLLRLKVIHNNIVDTSVLYPHPKGLPYRASLIFLKNKHLGRASAYSLGLKCRGDAQATMKLVRLKCK